jgi:hypothetical protein
MAPEQHRWILSFTVTLEADAATDPLAAVLQGDLAREVQAVLTRELPKFKFRDDNICSVQVRPSGKSLLEPATGE